MKKGIYFCAEASMSHVYGEDEQKAIAELLDISKTLITMENWESHKELLKDAEIVLSTWGGPVLGEELLAHMPNLEVCFYAAGDISQIMTEAAWERGIQITTAAAINAIPVAEFVLAQIIFSLKRGWYYAQQAKQNGKALWGTNKALPGMYRARIGLLSIGNISRHLIKLLENFDVEVVASCQNITESEAEDLGIKLIDMGTVFRTCDVVSVHLKSTEETRGIINKNLLQHMKPHAVLINTSRGSVINESDLVQFLSERPDVYACIDVTDPEPPPRDSLLLKLENVVLTPHLAGSHDREKRRLAKFIIEELNRHLSHQPLKGRVTREML